MACYLAVREYAQTASAFCRSDAVVAKSGSIPALSRNGNAPQGDESGRLRCIGVIGPRWKDGSFPSVGAVTELFVLRLVNGDKLCEE